MAKVLWVGRKDPVFDVLRRSGFDVRTIESGSDSSLDAQAILCWGPWPERQPLPSAPLVLCAEPSELPAIEGAVLRKAAVILKRPIDVPTLIRELEALIGHEWEI